MSIKKRLFHKNEAIVASCKRAKEGSGRLHLIGLVRVRKYLFIRHTFDCKTYFTQVSDGGVHSHIRHLFALLETAKEQGVPHTYIHFLGDGRDTAPRSASKYAQELLDFIKELGYGEIATVIGRYYAMDRDKRWERVKIAVDGLVQGEGEKVESGQEGIVKAIEANYAKDVTDEFLKPIIVDGDEGRIKGMSNLSCFLFYAYGATDNDTLFFFNYRSDRMREIVSVFGLPDKPMEVKVPKDLVSHLSDPTSIFLMNIYTRIGDHNDVTVQRRIPLFGSLPTPSHDQRPRRVAGKGGCYPGTYRR